MTISIRLGRLLLVAVSAASLGACVQSGAKLAADSAAILEKRTNHADLPSLTYKPVMLGETHEITIGEADPVILLDKYETVYAKAFALPKWTAPYMLKVSSYFSGSHQDPAVYYPTAIFLDEKYQELRRSHLSNFAFRRAGVQEGSALSGTIFVNEANKREAYMIIVSQRQAANGSVILNNIAVQQTAVVIPTAYGSMTWMAPPMGAQETTASTAAMASGKLKLIVEGYNPVGIGEKKQ